MEMAFGLALILISTLIIIGIVRIVQASSPAPESSGARAGSGALRPLWPPRCR